MHILYVCNEYPPAPHGGIGTFVSGLGHALVELGHEITVIGYDPSCTRTVWQSDHGLNILRMKKPFWGSIGVHLGRYELSPSVFLDRYFLSRQVEYIVRSRRIDLVESYDWSGPLWLRPSVPLVVRLHGANTAHAYVEGKKPGRLLHFFEKRNLKLSSHLVAVSRHIGDVTLRAFELCGSKFTVIYNGVDTDLFAPGNPDEKTADQIVYAGSIHPRKGIFELFRSMAVVFQKRPSARLVLAGRLPEGQKGASIKQELLNMLPGQFQASVQFLGHIPHSQMPKIYHRAAVAVFPSLAEAFGLTCAEAMSCGTPVVMTSRASGPELVQDTVSGLLADPVNPNELAGAILCLLQDASLRKSVSQNAVNHVREQFSLDMALQRNVQLYRSLL